MKELLKSVIEPLVRFPEELVIEEKIQGREIVLTVSANPDDIGRVIGRGGRTIGALRTVVKASAVKSNRRVLVDVIDD